MKFHVSSWKPEILNLAGRLLSKAYRISAGTFQRNYVPRHWIVMQNLKEYCLVAWKNEIRNLINFHVSSQKSKNLGFDGLPLSNAYNVLVEKIQKSFVSWHWRVMQSLKKIWLLFPKMPCGIWWILMPAIFVEDILCLSQKSTEELFAIPLKNEANCEEKLTCVLKKDMRNSANFDPTLKSYKICTFMGSFWPKYICLS